MPNNFKRTAHHSLQIDFTTGTRAVENTPSITPEPWPPAPANYWINTLNFAAADTTSSYAFNVDQDNNAYLVFSVASNSLYGYNSAILYKLDSSGNFVVDYQYTVDSATEPAQLQTYGARFNNNKMYAFGYASSAGLDTIFTIDKNLSAPIAKLTYRTAYWIASLTSNTSNEKLFVEGLDIYSGESGFFLTKLDSSDNIAWTIFTEAGTGSMTFSPKTAFLSDGSCIIVFTGLFTSYRCVVQKFDSSGTRIWTLSYGNANFWSSTNGLYVDQFDNIYVSSRMDNFLFVINIMKINSSGSVVWQKDIAHANGCVSNDIVVDQDGNCYVGGYQRLSTTDVALFKFDASGTLLWQRNLNLTVPSNANVGTGVIALSISNDNSLLLNTSTYNFSGSSLPTDEQCVMTMKLPGDGSLTGSYTVGTNVIDYTVSTEYTVSTATWPTSTTNNNVASVTPTSATFNTLSAAVVTTSVTEGI